MRSTSTLLGRRLVIGREVVGSVGLNGYKLTYSGVADSWPVKRDHKGTLSGMKRCGIQRQLDSALLLKLPVEASIEGIEAEAAVYDQVARARQIVSGIP